jgi:aspartate/methionine/tyrosine aminotransferase
LNPPVDEVKELQKEVKELKQYVEDFFIDYNDINEDTRIQLELVNEALAELQTKNKVLNKPRNPIGFMAPQYSQRTNE